MSSEQISADELLEATKRKQLLLSRHIFPPTRRFSANTVQLPKPKSIIKIETCGKESLVSVHFFNVLSKKSAGSSAKNFD
jgi:hypothetical protein